ncbi:hypothetical protein CEXT_411941 [Caerostris extrusa]|uniref:Uncharacterized protein n=1 Tax=Caerostris extrusa TaxID=172846 RepID=A0AAV4UI11_CAEEX|nr:hypothetical protein CEXT_411941 [Caerostris extrusa]
MTSEQCGRVDEVDRFTEADVMSWKWNSYTKKKLREAGILEEGILHPRTSKRTKKEFLHQELSCQDSMTILGRASCVTDATWGKHYTINKHFPG